MARQFVLLEILDKDVRQLLSSLRAIFSGEPARAPVHVTIRGPYPQPVRKDLMSNLEARLHNDVLLIAGAGIFRAKKSAAVYLKVSAKRLRSVWWKPDYPVKTHGFNPHITMYEGSDLGLAEAIYEFLRKEKIELVCHEFKVAMHAAGQFPAMYNQEAESRRGLSNLTRAGAISEGVLERARRLARTYRGELPLVFSD